MVIESRTAALESFVDVTVSGIICAEGLPEGVGIGVYLRL